MFCIVPNSGTLKGCVQMGMLEIEPFRSKKWNDYKSDTKDGTARNGSVLFPSEQANGKYVNGTVAFQCVHKQNWHAIVPFPSEQPIFSFQKLERR